MGLAQYADGGLFSPRKIAETLRTTSEKIARTAGLGRDVIQRKKRIRSDKTQRRLREETEIINKVEPRLGSALIATSMQLARDGRADETIQAILPR